MFKNLCILTSLQFSQLQAKQLKTYLFVVYATTKSLLFMQDNYL